MDLYRDSSHYSLEPHFNLLFDGRLLFTEEEMEELIALKGSGERVSPSLHALRRRFEEITGWPFLSPSGELGEEAARMCDIYAVKKRLSIEQLVHRWKSPSLAADSILYESGKILLVRRGQDPYAGYYALPGGIMDSHETLEECAVRELKEETGIEGEILALLNVYSQPERDPRVRMVSAVYVVRRRGGELIAGDDASEVLFWDINSLPPLAFDHSKVVHDFIGSDIFRRLL